MAIIGRSLTIPFPIGNEPAPPALQPEAAYLYQQLAPIAGEDEENGFATAHLCAVLMAPVELSYQLAAADGDEPGWRQVLDVDRAPPKLLAWLGQFNGTALDEGEGQAEEQRRKIREARGSHRGTKRAILSDLKATLTGSQSVVLLERNGGPFRNTFVTQAAETPDEAAARAVLGDRRTKPLCVINTLITGETPIIDEGTRTIDTSTGTIDTAKLSDIT